MCMICQHTYGSTQSLPKDNRISASFDSGYNEVKSCNNIRVQDFCGSCKDEWMLRFSHEWLSMLFTIQVYKYTSFQV